ncbi:hypothetical protein Poli38472_009976 [Pythium oligandrum]|uniref:mitogen-activated protein kinase kinase n=1 Tax=Pythium oligandrum TaxID=41045 RepID=A0A8K1C8B4_PYTOL|nr:hypothetical protein Poli38472_009976 [Pythium oligandrum]|eukprot:TMW58417.1 hypothetical protein Poli38472_009976 [Pythium oligandrum]
MKKRPVLTLVADDEDGGLLRPPQLTVKSIDDDDLSDEEEDGLEASCDIGETTFRKGPIHINRTGVTFVSDAKDSEKATDDSVKSDKTWPVRRPLTPPRRRQITLDELESCGLVGRGCSGHVLKAQHKVHRNEWYAIKVVNNVYDKSKRDQMLTEIRTLYNVESPYLVECFGAYFKDHQLSLVLEFCAVGSLDGLIQRHAPIRESMLACMTYQMLQGLLHLKASHHFHRDIKPQNILVQSNGLVKLTDFGIARELGNSQDMAQTFIGTFKYMSPERVQNEPYDYKSDIWSIGLVLIECATKVFPFRNARSYIDSIIECNDLELPADTADLSFSDDFRAFIKACLRKNPKQRASAEQLMESPWLERHRALDGSRCARRLAQWLSRGDVAEAKDEEYEDDFEVEEEIETYTDEK